MRYGFYIFAFLSLCALVTTAHLSSGEKEGQASSLTFDDSFPLLLGHETEAWRSMLARHPSYSAFYSQCEALYERNKNLQFDSPPLLKIPKTIHVIWLGPNPFPIESIANMRSWAAHHPDWTIKFWTDRQRIPPIQSMELHYVTEGLLSNLHAEYKMASNWAEKSEIVRYEVLLSEGGLYVDHNVVCHRPFHALHAAYDFCASLERPHAPFDHFSLALAPSVIAVSADHPIIRGTINAIAKPDDLCRVVSAASPTDDVIRSVQQSYIALTQSATVALDMPGYTDIIFPTSYLLGGEGLPSFYSCNTKKTAWKQGKQSDLELAFSNHISDQESHMRHLLCIELLSVTLLAFALRFTYSRQGVHL